MTCLLEWEERTFRFREKKVESSSLIVAFSSLRQGVKRLGKVKEISLVGSRGFFVVLVYILGWYFKTHKVYIFRSQSQTEAKFHLR